MRLISFLGTGRYETVRYHWNGRDCETRFVAEALVRLADADSAVILATAEAERCHGPDLSQAIAKAGKACRFERIHEGKTHGELWENFKRLADLLDTQAPTILDITHGFRSQPFFAGAVVSFVRATRRPVPPVQVVYGAYEARNKAMQTPIWDLTPFVELLDLTHAIDVFLTSGQAEDLSAKTSGLGRRLAKDGAHAEAQGRRGAIRDLGKALEIFSQALTTVRIGELLLADGGRPSAAERLLASLREAESDLAAYLPAVSRVLDEMRKMLEPLTPGQDHLSGEEGRRLMANLARLYLRLGRYAETGIVLREGWVNLYAEPDATRPGETFDEKKRSEAEMRLSNAGQAERELMGLRNDIEHGGFRKRPLPAKSIREQLERFVERFEQAAANVLEPAAERLTSSPRTVWFVTRHPGAVEWARRQGIQVDRLVDHLEIDQVQESDVVIGTLPVHLAAAVSARGARFLNLSLDLPPDERGKELSTDDLERFGARLEEYRLERVGEHRPASI